MLAGEVQAERLVAEGLEDLSCEGLPGYEVQVKSRQDRVGDFRTTEAARHVLGAWRRRAKRQAAAEDERTVVVLERAVDGYAPRGWNRSLADDPAWQALVAEIRGQVRLQNVSADDVEFLLARTTIVVLPQQIIMAEVATVVVDRTGLPAGATIPVLQAVRAAVAETADRNAELDWSARAGLSRTDVQRIVTDAAALVDRASLIEAVANGSCEPVDFDTPLPDPQFYSGSEVQPGHVAAGLVIPRRGSTEEVLAGLSSGRAVLVAGPSGVGKSAVVWLSAYVARHVVWYRVHRLISDDVEPLIRLAQAAGAGEYGPVGFVIDGVGSGSLRAWDELQRRAAAIPGVLLLGSVREEDTLPLATFGRCVVVRPRLDQDIAAHIHAALLESGATTQPHWREAYELSDGLTLEFTHLLTRGRRLKDVLTEQVDTRVRERRDDELAVLAPVSVTHRWGASLPVNAVAELAETPPAAMRAALARLIDEHLITVHHDLVEGVHPLRSAALCDAIHRVPPPTLAATVCRVLPQLKPEQLASFLAQSIANVPALGPPVVDALSSYLASAHRTAAATATALAGLRLADFTATAREWVAVLDEHGVSTPHRPLALALAMLESELVEAFDPRLISAVEEIRRRRNDSASTLRDQFIEAIGASGLARLLASASVAEAIALLAPLAGTRLEITSRLGHLSAVLEDAGLGALGRLIDAARAVSPATGQALLECAGGEPRILDSLKREHPWLLDIAVVEDGSEQVLTGRVLYLGDRLSPGPEKYIKSLAQQAMLCLPNVDRANLTTVVAGGARLQTNGLDLFTSGLLREYVHSSNTVAWNRARARFARSLVAAPSTTERLAAGLDMLKRSADFLADLAEAWVTDRGIGDRLQRLNRQRDDLLKAVQALAPQLAIQPLGSIDPDTGGWLENDPLHGVAHGIVQNLASRLAEPAQYGSLAAFVGDTIRKQLRDAEAEPWSVLGYDSPPIIIARLETLLGQLASVLAELAFGDTTPTQIKTATRDLPRGRALERAATLCTARAQSRYQSTTRRLVQQASQRGVTIEVLSKTDPAAKAVVWPPLSTALVVDIDNSAYDAVLATSVDLLARFPLPGSTAIVIPKRAGVPLLHFAMRVLAPGNTYPDKEGALSWQSQIPHSPTPCVDAVTEGIDALCGLSSLAYLASQRSCDQVTQDIADEAVARFHRARESLAGLADDDVIAALVLALDELADRVQAELDSAEAAEYLAGQCMVGREMPNQEYLHISTLVVLASEWDLDPAQARTLLASLEDPRSTME